MKKQMNLLEKIEKYTEYFKHQNYDDVLDFKFVTSELFNHFDWENESDCQKIEGLYDNLKEITFSNCPKYGGYLFLFTQIQGVDSDGDSITVQDFDIYFNWDIAVEHGYDWHDIIASGETVVHKVANEYDQDDFNNHFASLFVLTLLGSVDNAQSEEIAEFIVANNVKAYKKVFQDTEDEDFVSDIVINILKIIGYDIHDYEMDGGFCTINGIHFLDAGLDMGYDYLRLAEDFRDSNI